MIRAEKINAVFGSNHVINDISLNVGPLGSLVVLGKNGSGKSVLLKCLAGLIENYTGIIEIDGIKSSNQLYYRQGHPLAAYVFQKGGLFDSLTVFDNVAFGLRRRKMNEDEIQSSVMEVLVSVGLEGSENKLPSELSGGMQKRAGLARAICMKPKVIMYDDPTAGLDPVLTDQIADLMLKIRDDHGITSVTVTHDLKLAQKISDDIMLIYKGSQVYYGSGDDFFSKTSSYARQFIEGDADGPIDIF